MFRLLSLQHHLKNIFKRAIEELKEQKSLLEVNKNKVVVKQETLALSKKLSESEGEAMEEEGEAMEEEEEEEFISVVSRKNTNVDEKTCEAICQICLLYGEYSLEQLIYRIEKDKREMDRILHFFSDMANIEQIFEELFNKKDSIFEKILNDDESQKVVVSLVNYIEKQTENTISDEAKEAYMRWLDNAASNCDEAEWETLLQDVENVKKSLSAMKEDIDETNMDCSFG